METYRPQRAADAVPVLPAPLASSSDSFRPIFLRTGAVAQAAGSAYIECGRTKVLCAVHGPRRSTHTDNDAERGRVWCDFKFAPFAQTQRRRRGQDPDEREFSTLVAQALETSVLLHKFPKNVLEVYIMVLEDDGGAIATALSCASLALVDAGIEVYDMIAACNSSVVDGRIVIDPPASADSNLFEHLSSEATELQTATNDVPKHSGITGGLLIACMPSIGQVVHLTQLGALSKQTASESLRMCTDSCAKLHALMREHLHKVSSKKLGPSQA